MVAQDRHPEVRRIPRDPRHITVFQSPYLRPATDNYPFQRFLYFEDYAPLTEYLTLHDCRVQTKVIKLESMGFVGVYDWVFGEPFLVDELVVVPVVPFVRVCFRMYSRA